MTICDFTEPTTTDAAALDLPEGVPPLRSFYLYMSTSCNLRCRHCWIAPRFVDDRPPSGDVLDVDGLRAAVREARPMGLRGAKLTGGEPMLHPRFQDVVDMLTGEGLRLNMETNGTLLTVDMAQHLKDKTAVGFISVSIDGADAATHDAFRGVPGAFDAALRGLDYLVNAGYSNTQVIMCVHRGNRHQIEDVVRLAAEHGAGSIKISPVANAGRGAAMRERGEHLDFDERMALARYVNDGLRHCSPISVAFNTPPALTPLPHIEQREGNMGDCGVRHILGILGTGEIALCGIGRTVPELVYGRLGRDSIRDIWLTHPSIVALRGALDDVRAFPGICGQCAHVKQCRTGCVAQNYVDGRQLVWPSWLCSEAERRGEFPATRKTRGIRQARHREVEARQNPSGTHANSAVLE